MKFSWWKFIVGYILYIFFHQFYDIFPGTWVGIVFGVGIDSVYAHMKMLFYAYVVVSLIDYFLRRNTIQLEAFVYAGMLILASVPWMMIVIYYVVEALRMELPRIPGLIWALVATALGLYFSIRLEQPFEQMPLRDATKAMIAIAFLTALITYVGFSFFYRRGIRKGFEFNRDRVPSLPVFFYRIYIIPSQFLNKLML